MTDTVKEKRKSTRKAKAEEKAQETVVSAVSEDLFPIEVPVKEKVQEEVASKQEELAPEIVPERMCDMMRRVRLEKRLDLNDASAYLCIRAQFLRAIEEGNLKELPGEAYASGFIRSYASFLGLDPNKTERLYREEIQKGLQEKIRPVSEEEIEKAAPDNKIIMVSLALLIVLSVAWKFYSDSAQEVSINENQTQEAAFEPANPYPSDNVTTTIDSYEPQVKEPSVIPPVPPKKPAVPEEKVSVVSESVEEKTQQETAVENVEVVKSELVEEKAKTAEKPLETASVAQEVEPVVQKPYVPKIFGVKNVDARIVLRAKEDTWIEVTRGQEVLLTRTLRAGDRYRVPVDSADLLLKTGNAGGLDVLVDGTLVPALGRRGATKSNVVLDADSLLETLPEEN